MYTDYQIISDYSRKHLEQSIIVLLKEGWHPVGGISVVLYTNNPDEYVQENGDAVMYSQAVAK